MKKILFLYNNYERERVIIDIISRELREYHNVVQECGFTEKDMLSKVIKFNPDIIITYPITTYAQVQTYRVIKMICNCIMITFTTEGLADMRKREIVQLKAGHYDYSYRLIDYHLFWGNLFANKIGKELFDNKRIASKAQIKVFGNPMYETEKIQQYYAENNYMTRMKKDSRIKVLVLTGFQNSEYTKQDMLRAQDIVNIKKTKEEIEHDETFLMFCERFKKERMYRDKYISMIIDTAKRNPDVTFYVKLHPQEIKNVKEDRCKARYLSALKYIDNIVLIQESIPIGSLLKYCSLLVHYGSTVDLEAYLYQVPTLKLEDRNSNNVFTTAGARLTESTYYEDIDDEDAIQKYIEKIKIGKKLFRKSELAEKKLYAYMNYKEGKQYCPSEEMAAFLNSDLKKRRLKLTLDDIKEVVSILWKEFVEI